MPATHGAIQRVSTLLSTAALATEGRDGDEDDEEDEEEAGEGGAVEEDEAGAEVETVMEIHGGDDL